MGNGSLTVPSIRLLKIVSTHVERQGKVRGAKWINPTTSFVRILPYSLNHVLVLKGNTISSDSRRITKGVFDRYCDFLSSMAVETTRVTTAAGEPVIRA